MHLGPSTLLTAALLRSVRSWFSIETVLNWVEGGGYYVVFGLLFACGLGLPLPEDIPLIIGGYFVATGHLHLGILAVWAWCGIIGGDCVLYTMGRRYGLNITRVPVIGKHVTRARIERAEALFADWGVWVVAIGRMFAGVRGAVVIAAGATRFNFIKFIIADGLGAVVSGGLFIALGHWAGTKLGDLGELSRKVRRYENILLAIGIAVAVAIVAYVWWRRRRHETIADAAIKAVEHKIERRTHAHDSTAQPPEQSDPANRPEINTDK